MRVNRRRRIPSEIGTTLTDRQAWEEHYVARLQYCEERIPVKALEAARAGDASRDIPLALHCGSLYGFGAQFDGRGRTELYAGG